MYCQNASFRLAVFSLVLAGTSLFGFAQDKTKIRIRWTSPAM